ncbi:MAG: acyltransferase family protein [Faecousia sp.]
MEKDYAVSSIRLISTITVVVLHILQQLERMNSNLHILTDWCNLGLVLFFCMSGYLYSSRTITQRGKWLWHRYKEIVIPSIITVIATLVVYLLCVEIPDGKVIAYSLVSGLGFESFVPNGWMFIQLWFLTYILFCYLSVPFIQKIKVCDMSEMQFWGMLIAGTAVIQGGSMLLKRLFDISVLSWGVLLRFYLSYFIYRRYENNDRQKKVYIYGCCYSQFLC